MGKTLCEMCHSRPWVTVVYSPKDNRDHLVCRQCWKEAKTHNA